MRGVISQNKSVKKGHECLHSRRGGICRINTAKYTLRRPERTLLSAASMIARLGFEFIIPAAAHHCRAFRIFQNHGSITFEKGVCQGFRPCVLASLDVVYVKSQLLPCENRYISGKWTFAVIPYSGSFTRKGGLSGEFSRTFRCHPAGRSESYDSTCKRCSGDAADFASTDVISRFGEVLAP